MLAIRHLALPLLIWPLVAGAEQDSHPADAAATVPGTSYRALIPEDARKYGATLDDPRLPWRSLFRSDGRFMPEMRLETPSSNSSPSAEPAPRDHRMSHRAHGKPEAAGKSDARGLVKALDHRAAKVKLEHGPIEKLGMPGMTMIFRVKDPKLLDQVREGEEVGFTVEIEGTTFYVTGFQR